MGHRTGVLPVSPELSVELLCPENSLSAGDDLAGWVLLLRARRSDSASPLSFPGQPRRVAFRERVWLFIARTRNRPASPPVPGDAGAEVTDEPVRVISRAAAIDVAKGPGMVCMRLPHESRAGRRTQKVREVTATFAAVVAVMDHLVCQGVERLVLESTSVIRGRQQASATAGDRPALSVSPSVADGLSAGPSATQIADCGAH